jgi:transcriptional regulator of acetoin/glycerol metabolism
MPIEVDDQAMEVLVHYEWPGNVRELRSVVSTLVLLGDGGPIVRSDVLTTLDRPATVVSGDESVMIAARAALTRLLEDCGWDTSLAAAELRIHRVTVYRRMRALGISVPAVARHRDEYAR